MLTKTVQMIEVRAWDKLVSDTYKRIYNFQQQDGCMGRGIYEFTVPLEYPEDYENDTLPEEVNHEEMGVSFNAWLERDPDLPLDTTDEWGRKNGLGLWWSRNFYPCIDMVINDLYSKGLLASGNYVINIDW